VTETDYFRELQGRADRLRARPAGRAPAVSVAAEAQAP
jgi:hypothetical protein